MIPTTDTLVSEFIDAWNAGRRPDVLAYLRRVPEGGERDELARALDTWLELAPTPAYSGATRAAIRAEPVVQRVLGADAGLWPEVLPALRAQSRLSVGQLAARVVARFKLAGADAESRVVGHLEELERGELEPARVSRRLLDALADALGVSPGTLFDAGRLGQGLRPAAAGGALFRAEDADADLAADLELLAAAAHEPAPPSLDPIDRLFLGGPEG